ncbi:MAG: hypothetical protein LC104_02165 [Bacteroidales bacterium]|nr:hypothetical protein [Bacteroidales bacterium]
MSNWASETVAPQSEIPQSEIPQPETPQAVPPPMDPTLDPKIAELQLEALKAALSQEGEQRLFRAGKLPGLFATKTGLAAQAATQALAAGLFEVVRSETRGKSVTEWVRATPAGVRFVQEHDSPKSVLRELREVLSVTRNGVPVFLDAARQSVAELAEQFAQQSAELMQRLDALTERVEAALRRADAASTTTTIVAASEAPAVVPWAEAAMAYLDQRRAIGASGPCPLRELFHVVQEGSPNLTLMDFHDGLRRMADHRVIQLSGVRDGVELLDIEYAMMCGTQVCGYASR